MITRTCEELRAMREAARARYLAVAARLKVEAGVTQHLFSSSLSGRAFASGKIIAPEGRTRKQLYVLAHECAHLALKHFARKQPRHVEEFQAEKWAHDALRRHGIPVPRTMTRRAKQYVARKIGQARRRGAKQIDPETARYAESEGAIDLVMRDAASGTILWRERSRG